MFGLLLTMFAQYCSPWMITSFTLYGWWEMKLKYSPVKERHVKFNKWAFFYKFLYFFVLCFQMTILLPRFSLGSHDRRHSSYPTKYDWFWFRDEVCFFFQLVLTNAVFVVYDYIEHFITGDNFTQERFDSMSTRQWRAERKSLSKLRSSQMVGTH